MSVLRLDKSLLAYSDCFSCILYFSNSSMRFSAFASSTPFAFNWFWNDVLSFESYWARFWNSTYDDDYGLSVSILLAVCSTLLCSCLMSSSFWWICESRGSFTFSCEASPSAAPG